MKEIEDSQVEGEGENSERILARTLAVDLTTEELEEASGGAAATTTSCGCDCECDD